MAKKQEVKKMTNKEIIEKCIKTTEYLIAPVTAVLAIWDIQAGTTVAAIAGFIVSGLRLAETCIKD